ncbi:MAG: hypothetical protein ACOX68_02160 [Candidatus Limivicinus sp.]
MSKAKVTLQKVSDNKVILYLAAALISLGFGIFTILTAEKVNVYYPILTAVIYGGLLFLSQALLISRKRFDALSLLIAAGCLACVIFARVSLLYFVSDDFEFFLKLWVEKLGKLSVKEALSTPIGDYNLPYIYILLIISRLNIDPMLAIKSLSCIFDVILAFVVMKLVMFGIEDRRLQLASFILTLAAPTVMINSAQWSQCDAIYVSFCLISMLAALQNKGRLCAISWTIAFCFKLQAIFILPALGIAFFMGKIKARYLLWIPVVFLLSMLPAMIAGRSLGSCLSIYAHQTQEYGFLFHNAPTIWRFFEGADFESFSVVSVFVAGAAVILFMYFCLTFLRELKTRDLIKLFFISSFLVPYLLPRMHERYFYMADILALVYFMYDRRKWYIPTTLILSSVISYMFYFTENVIIDQKYISIAFLVILATETQELFRKFWRKTPDTIPVK